MKSAIATALLLCASARASDVCYSSGSVVDCTINGQHYNGWNDNGDIDVKNASGNRIREYIGPTQPDSSFQPAPRRQDDQYQSPADTYEPAEAPTFDNMHNTRGQFRANDIGYPQATQRQAQTYNRAAPSPGYVFIPSSVADMAPAWARQKPEEHKATKCEFKSVMTDEDIALCRNSSR